MAETTNKKTTNKATTDKVTTPKITPVEKTANIDLEQSTPTDIIVTSTVRELNLNDKSKVKNLCNWSIGWLGSNGIEVQLKANTSALMTNAEIEIQIDNGNTYLCGTDGLGSHAKVYVENDLFREYKEFDNKATGKKQFILNDNLCKQLFEMSSKQFKEKLPEYIVQNQEKTFIIAYAKTKGINEYDKIQALESHCGLSIKD